MFENKKPNAEKLIKYGFIKTDNGYEYTVGILDGQFTLRITADGEGVIKTALYDSAAGGIYTLHLVKDAGGEFVGRVRSEYERVLSDVEERCFESTVFKDGIICGVLDGVRKKYGNEPEYLWEKTPDCAVLRRSDSGKWYAVIMTLPRKRLGLDGDGSVVILDVRCSPEKLSELIDGNRFFPGYHMNKKHWLTVLADGSADVAEILDLIDKSYTLAK